MSAVRAVHSLPTEWLATNTGYSADDIVLNIIQHRLRDVVRDDARHWHVMGAGIHTELYSP